MDFDRKITELDVNDILPNRFQPRIKFNEESINELCDSIREHGVIQPIVVRKMGDKFEIIAGERRYKASLLAGKNLIPAVITELNDKESAEIALIENVQRKDLTPIEEAISYKKILDMGYLTQDDLAIKLGKTQSTVANKLRLLNLSEDVQEALLEGKISERHARSILRLPNAAMQKQMLDKIILERLTVRKADEEISKILKGEIEAVENKMAESLVPYIDNNQVNFMTAPNFDEQLVVENKNEENNKQDTNDIGYTPYYEKEEENTEVVPTFNGIDKTIIPTLNIEPEIEEEPIIVIEEEENMNNNGNNTLNNINNEFNPFDMSSNISNNNVEIPSAPIEESPQLSNNLQNENNDFVSIDSPKNTEIEEPTYNYQNNNSSNPGFMDIEKIKNEAVDINVLEENKVDNTNYNFNDLNPLNQNNSEPLLKDSSANLNQVQEEEFTPGKFFHLPVEEEKDYNEEVKVDSNPFEMNLKNTTNNFDLNLDDQPKLKTLDQVSQFSESTTEVTPAANNFIQPMMTQEVKENNNNPVNDFGISNYNFNQGNDLLLTPTNTEIEPMVQNKNQQIHPISNQTLNSQQTMPQFTAPIEKSISVPQQEKNSFIQNMAQHSFVPQQKDINTAMLAIKECESKLKRLGFNVNTEDFDFENMYQIMFRIEK